MTYQVKPHQGRSMEIRHLLGWQRLATMLAVSHPIPVDVAQRSTPSGFPGWSHCPRPPEERWHDQHDAALPCTCAGPGSFM